MCRPTIPYCDSSGLLSQHGHIVCELWPPTRLTPTRVCSFIHTYVIHCFAESWWQPSLSLPLRPSGLSPSSPHGISSLRQVWIRCCCVSSLALPLAPSVRALWLPGHGTACSLAPGLHVSTESTLPLLNPPHKWWPHYPYLKVLPVPTAPPPRLSLPSDSSPSPTSCQVRV